MSCSTRFKLVFWKGVNFFQWCYFLSIVYKLPAFLYALWLMCMAKDCASMVWIPLLAESAIATVPAHIVSKSVCLSSLPIEGWHIYPMPAPEVVYTLVKETAAPNLYSSSFWMKFYIIFNDEVEFFRRCFSAICVVVAVVAVGHVAYSYLMYKFLFEYNLAPWGDWGYYRNLVYGPLDVSPQHQVKRYKPRQQDFSEWYFESHPWDNPRWTLEVSLKDLEYKAMLRSNACPIEWDFNNDIDPFSQEDMISFGTALKPDPTILRKCAFDPKCVDSDLMGMNPFQDLTWFYVLCFSIIIFAFYKTISTFGTGYVYRYYVFRYWMKVKNSMKKLYSNILAWRNNVTERFLAWLRHTLLTSAVVLEVATIIVFSIIVVVFIGDRLYKFFYMIYSWVKNKLSKLYKFLKDRWVKNKLYKFLKDSWVKNKLSKLYKFLKDKFGKSSGPKQSALKFYLLFHYLGTGKPRGNSFEQAYWISKMLEDYANNPFARLVIDDLTRDLLMVWYSTENLAGVPLIFKIMYHRVAMQTLEYFSQIVTKMEQIFFSSHYFAPVGLGQGPWSWVNFSNVYLLGDWCLSDWYCCVFIVYFFNENVCNWICPTCT
jgi:hypothetical protein